MRHVSSLAAGIVAAPVIWFLVALGQGSPKAGGWLLLGVGVVAGLIATLRTSPLGSIFAGLIFTGASVLMFLKTDRAMEVFTTDWEFREYSVNVATPLTSGVLAFAGGLLLMSVFSVSRWRGRNSAADDDNFNPIPPEEYSPWRSRSLATEQEDRWNSPMSSEDRWTPTSSEETYSYR